MSVDIAFTKDNLDVCLSKLAKEFRKSNGTKLPAEIILIGGAAVLANYGFRDMTYDIDAIIRASSAMKEAINKVGDELGLSNGWLNSDFIDFEKKYPGVTNVDNVNDIIKGLKKRKENKQLILSNLPWEEILPGSFFLTSNPNKNIIKIS